MSESYKRKHSLLVFSPRRQGIFAATQCKYSLTATGSSLLRLKIAFILISFYSCSYQTDTFYRQTKDEEFIKLKGCIIECRVKDDYKSLSVSVMTAENMGKYYTDYLKQKDGMIKVNISKLKIIGTNNGDTLTLDSIRKEEKSGKEIEYNFNIQNLKQYVANNEKLTLKIIYQADSLGVIKSIDKEFILTRFEHRYHSGTLPHG